MHGYNYSIKLLQKIVKSGEISKYLSKINDYFKRESPIFRFLGIEIIEISRGKAILKFQYNKNHTRIGGIIHGGIIVMALDQAMGTAALTVNPGRDQVTMEIKVNYLKTLNEKNSPYTVIGVVLRSGKNTIVVKGEVWDNYNELSAVSTGTWFIIY